jgi:nicotinamide-nucleotide adenylyltransferase
MTRAAFIGRFQPFHEGHRQVREEYREKFNLVVVIGSAGKSREEDNPLIADEREEIIRECFPDLEVFRKEDEETKEEEDNRRWIRKIEEEMDAEKIISRNNLVRRIVKNHSEAELVEQELHDPEIYSGSEIRRRIRSGEEWRYLVPGCAEEKIEEYEDIIDKSGHDYDFEPGWKKENAHHGTVDSDQ